MNSVANLLLYISFYNDTFSEAVDNSLLDLVGERLKRLEEQLR